MKPANRRKLNRSDIKRYRWVFLLGIFVLLLNAPTSSLAQQRGISIGDTVEVTSADGLRLHTEPGLSTPVVVTLPYKTQMNVVGGPRSNIDGFTWWELEGTQGRGWAAESYLRVVGGAPLPDGESGCEPPYPAIQYCPPEANDPHVILIDLNDPHVRIETVMANAEDSVNTSARESIEKMGQRFEDAGAVVVINADYFGGGHGPEGFTVVNGIRLDGSKKNDNDNMAVLRSSVAFSQSRLDGGSSPITISIQRFENDVFTLDTERMFNAVGGGPQIIFNGAWDWTRGRDQTNYNDYPECPADFVDHDVINGECFRNTMDQDNEWDNPAKMWTVVGKTSDGRLLLLLTTYPSVRSALETNRVQEAIKLDGGGSSQIWYDRQWIVRGDLREVANGLAVFYKNAYEIIEGPPQWPVVVSGERLDIQMTLKNTGADTWTQKDYALISTRNPWDTELKFELPNAVRHNDTLTWKWQSDPIDRTWGIYSLDLQLLDHGREFPTEPIRIRVIVIPVDLAEKKQELEQRIREWTEKGIEDIEKEITEWIERQVLGFWKWLQNQVYLWIYENCYLPITTLLIAALILHRRSHLYRK